MACPGIQIWTWTLCVLSCMCVNPVMGVSRYMVAIPAVLESGADTQLCASLLQPTEILLMTVTLVSQQKNTTLFSRLSSQEFSVCTQFKVPLVQVAVIQNLTVEVRGVTFYSTDVKKVMITVYNPMTFVQLDKPIYLPGQTVNFRVVTLDTKLRPVNQTYDTIGLQDVGNNLIGQWLNQTSNGTILQLSYSLNSEAQQGSYTIIVSIGANKVYQNFQVENYVLPKFAVTISSSDQVSVGQRAVTADVCANYTYGQPVPGNVTLVMCRPLQQYIYNPGPVAINIPAPCYNETKQANKTGCATFSFSMSIFTKADKVVQDVLDLAATVEEQGTGILQQGQKSVTVSYVLGTFSFIQTPTVYTQGATVLGKVKAVDYNNVPLANMALYLFVGEIWSSSWLQNVTTDKNGVATFSLSTTKYSGSIHLYVSSTPALTYPPYRIPYYQNGDQILSMAQPVSSNAATISSLVVNGKTKPISCNVGETISIQYTVVGETQGSMFLAYLVLSRGAINMLGSQRVQLQSSSVTVGQVSFKVNVSPAMAPYIQVVAYAVLPSETVIANSATFPTEKCFSLNASVAFLPPSAVPGETTTMQVTSQPGSLCGISAVDQSVSIMAPGQNLVADKIFNLLPVTQLSYIPYEVQDPTNCLPVRQRRLILPSNQAGAFTVFQNVGLKMATNLFIQMPSCLLFKGNSYYSDTGIVYPLRPLMAMAMAMPAGLAAVAAAPAPAGGIDVATPAPPIVTVRTYFPETWIWSLVAVGASGTKNVSFTVPDTITTWQTEAFCLSPQGFGLAPRKEITVFQPFFLDLTLPYSIIRGEQFILKATVFNYLSSCIMVTVTPAPSSGYTLTTLSGNQYTSCLCSNERKTLSWTLVPSTIGTVNVSVTAQAVASQTLCQNTNVSVPDRGRIDAVTQSLIVKAEGSEMTQTYSWLLCPKAETLTNQIDIKLPNNMINGSARASVSVLGDILGRALNNLDGLLQMPYGCGEQNMALLAPDIYILQYLKSTKQLTPTILNTATNFLIDGYQRQLIYKDDAGAYSTFGSGPQNTWLTAFVVRCFSKAQSFIFIDPTTIAQSKTWLINQQQASGCFAQSGKLFHNLMKGGVSDQVTLSAYITAAFLEMNMSVTSPVITQSLACLKTYINLNSTYTKALLAYVFTLAGDMNTRTQLLQQLDMVAIKQGGFLYWTQTATETSASLSVEISSYVLLAKLSASPTASDLGYSSGIVRWLTGQQNYNGGFSSTQDTVVALQALALYATLVFTPGGSSTVTVQSPSGQLTFTVNKDNKLLYQEKMLPQIAGNYTLNVTGNACASVQVSLTYNVPTPRNITTLNVTVKATSNTCKALQPKVTLNISALYTGKQNSTNMVIVDIKMLSGFILNPDSLTQLQNSAQVASVDQTEDHVLLYIQALSNGTPLYTSLELIEEVPVQNRKPAVVKLYDYYEPSNQALTEYTYPCAAA